TRPAQIKTNPNRYFRPAVFLCDEYQSFASVGEDDPAGDEKAFALTRQSRVIPIVATQSISSLKSVLTGQDAWRTLLQSLRTNVFLSLSDDSSAELASNMCGKVLAMERHRPAALHLPRGRLMRSTLLAALLLATGCVTGTDGSLSHLSLLVRPTQDGEAQGEPDESSDQRLLPHLAPRLLAVPLREAGSLFVRPPHQESGVRHGIGRQRAEGDDRKQDAADEPTVSADSIIGGAAALSFGPGAGGNLDRDGHHVGAHRGFDVEGRHRGMSGDRAG
ncbi:MAG: TraM recognition domain-containing protein, partial [Chloroflexi bacterium]|nr:TraM recognition domain-containing protein [Chloroflexota bacterium]